MISDQTKNTIDNMDYESMLYLWRNSPSGHPMFQDEVGDYFSQSMKDKREKLGNEEHTRASKNIGWHG